jgi:hypothetical protein
LIAAHSPEKPGPPQKIAEEETEDRTTYTVPTSKKQTETQQSASTGAATQGDPPPGAHPIHFGTYVASGSSTTGVAAVSNNAADISGADSPGGIAIHTGNWYVDLVDGSTVTRYDPTSVFPAPLVGGFCCDQVITYVRSINRFVWYMQYDRDASGDGGFRLAVATPAAVHTNFQTAWTYWDATDATFGESGKMLDYPDLSATDANLIGTTNVPGAGRVVFRIPLQELTGAGSLSLQYVPTTALPDSMFNFSHLAQHGVDAAFLAGHADNSTVRVMYLPDGSSTYSFHDVGVSTWPNGPLSSVGADGTDWLDAPWGTTSILGAARTGERLWLAWTASSGAATTGGPNFPNAHVRVVSIDITAWTTAYEMQVWNPDYAFGYPFLDTNSRGEVAIIVGWGGHSNNANTAEGIIGDYVVWYHTASDVTPNRFGDFITVRRSGDGGTDGTGTDFAAFGYYTTHDSTRSSGYLFTPYYDVFGH